MSIKDRSDFIKLTRTVQDLVNAVAEIEARMETLEVKTGGLKKIEIKPQGRPKKYG